MLHGLALWRIQPLQDLVRGTRRSSSSVGAGRLPGSRGAAVLGLRATFLAVAVGLEGIGPILIGAPALGPPAGNLLTSYAVRD